MPLTLDQLARRRDGIGASEIASIVGLSRWRSAISVWQDKCEPSQAQSATVDTERGDFLEPALREWYAYRFDRQVALSDTLQHPEHEIVLATPDGISAPAQGKGEPILLEIKSPGRHTQHDWGEDGTDQIPLYYLPQVTWAMAVAQLSQAHVVALVHSEMRCFTVPFDQDLFDELLSKGQDFWSNHVLPRVPPPVDGSAAYAEYLARKFRRVQEDTEVAETFRGNQWARRVRIGQERLKRAEDLLEMARNQVKGIMGPHDRMASDIGHFTWRKRKDQTVVDWRAVAEEMGATGELVARHSRVRPGTRTFLAHLRPGTDDTAEGEADE